MAASFWSLLAPAIELSEEEGYSLSFMPALIGFLLGSILNSPLLHSLSLTPLPSFLPQFTFFLGCLFVSLSDYLLPEHTSHPPPLPMTNKDEVIDKDFEEKETFVGMDGGGGLRRRGENRGGMGSMGEGERKRRKKEKRDKESWRRLILLVVAVTIHNFPEGLAVGVGYGGASGPGGLERADLLAMGIGIQNFPEGPKKKKKKKIFLFFCNQKFYHFPNH